MPTKVTSTTPAVSSWATSRATAPPNDQPSRRIGPVGAMASTVSA